MVDRLPRGHALKVALAFACVYLIWGSTFFGIRVALETMPPLFLCGARLVVAALVLAAYAWKSGAPWPRGIEWRNAAFVGLLLPAFGNGSVTLGETHVASGLVALMVASIPMWTALFAALGPERVALRRRAVAGLVAGFLGIAWLIGPGLGGAGRVSAAWALIPIAGSMVWAWGSLWSRRAAMPASSLTGTTVGMGAGGVALLLASGATGEWSRLTPAAFRMAPVAALLYLAVFGSALTLTAYLWLLRHVPATRVSTYAFVNPVVAMLIGSLVGGEPFGGRVAFAAGLIVVAVALIVTAPAATRTPGVAPSAAPFDGEATDPAA